MQIVLGLLLGGIVGWWLRHRRWRHEIHHYRRQRMVGSDGLDSGADAAGRDRSSAGGESADEVTRLRDRIAELEAQLRDARRGEGGDRDERVRQAQGVLLPSNGGAPEEVQAENDSSSSTSAGDGGRPDDLQRVNGIGPKMERVLNEEGINTLEQLATLDAADIERLETNLDNFAGRIERDDWVGQAQALVEADRST